MLRPLFRKRLALFCKNDMNLAANEKIDELFPLAACRPMGSFLRMTVCPKLASGTRTSKSRPSSGLRAWLSSTPRWGCGYRCEGTASVSLVQRFYASSYGRFNTPDPSRRSAKRRNPLSWNRYSYTLGDPVNGNDPTGLILDEDDGWGGDGDGDGGGDGFGDGVDPGPSPDDPVFTVTGTGCSATGEVYTGGPNGTCDQPIGGAYVGALQQVGNSANGIYTMVGAVAGGSALIGTVGGVVAAGYLGSTLGLGGTAAAGAAASPQGQQVINTVLNISGTIADSAQGQIILQTGQVGDLAGAIGNATTIAAQTGNQVVLGMGNAIPFANGSVNQVIMNNVPIGSGLPNSMGRGSIPLRYSGSSLPAAR